MGIVIVAIAAIVVATAVLLLRTGRRAKGLPPGPPTSPVLGNLHQIPKSSPHYQFTQWAQQYGGIFSLKLGPGTAIVLTDPRLIKQLLDKRGSIYNDRPSQYIGYDLITGGNHILLMPYSDRWRRARKIMAQYLNESRVEREHVQLIEAEASQMLHDFMKEPEKFNLHPKRFSNSIIMSIIYGIRTETTDVKHMKELYEIMEQWSVIMETGATPPVDLLPWLKYVPERFFDNWKSRAKVVKNAMGSLYQVLSQRVLNRRVEGVNAGCMLDYILDQEPDIQYERYELNIFGGTVMEGGSDTTSSMILAFIHAMIKYPHVQQKAQAELDRVIGSSRAPKWEDYDDLPYIAQVVKETMRWRPVTPLGIPHATTTDDQIDGYWIPKGSTIIMNTWGLHNMPRTEKESPTSGFDPDRFEGRTKLASEYAGAPDHTTRDHYGYGAGRRICPGIHLAERNLFIAMAKLLWAFKFKENPEHPVDINPRTGYTEGFLHCAKPFQCNIITRANKSTVIEEDYDHGKQVFARYEN